MNGRQVSLFWLLVGLAISSLVIAASRQYQARDEGDSVAVREMETERLVCALAMRGDEAVGISCVPKVPGLFEDGS